MQYENVRLDREWWVMLCVLVLGVLWLALRLPCGGRRENMIRPGAQRSAIFVLMRNVGTTHLLCLNFSPSRAENTDTALSRLAKYDLERPILLSTCLCPHSNKISLFFGAGRLRRPAPKWYHWSTTRSSRVSGVRRTLFQALSSNDRVWRACFVPLTIVVRLH